MDNQFFNNQYMGNPAMAGTAEGLELNGALKAQWTNIEGAPVMQSITATYGFPRSKVGVGLNLYNESAGVIKRTSAKMTYAFHLPLSEGSSAIDLGISGGIMNETLDISKVRGDIDDVSFYDFNARPLSIDGDFGVAFRNKNVTIQGALPNMKRLLKRDERRAVADRTLYMAAAGFLVVIDDGTDIEAKAAYRGIENFSDMYDAGLNLKCIDKKILLSSIYHSTKNVTFGLGMVYKEQLSIMGNYTSNSLELKSYTNGQFEIGVKYNFIPRKPNLFDY